MESLAILGTQDDLFSFLCLQWQWSSIGDFLKIYLRNVHLPASKKCAPLTKCWSLEYVIIDNSLHRHKIFFIILPTSTHGKNDRFARSLSLFLLPIWWNDCRGLKGPSHILSHVNEGQSVETNPQRRIYYLSQSCDLPQEAPFSATGHCLLLLWKSIFCCRAENHFWNIGIFFWGKVNLFTWMI